MRNPIRKHLFFTTRLKKAANVTRVTFIVMIVYFFWFGTLEEPNSDAEVMKQIYYLFGFAVVVMSFVTSSIIFLYYKVRLWIIEKSYDTGIVDDRQLS